jgi:malate dehydrogenase
MVPVLSKTEVKGKPISKVAPEDAIIEIVKRAKNRGAEVVSYLKTGSAYYSPSAACFQILKAIKNDTKEVLCVSAYLSGEYGLKDLFIGVPAKIGKNGIEEIIELDLDEKEKKEFHASARVIKEALKKL